MKGRVIRSWAFGWLLTCWFSSVVVAQDDAPEERADENGPPLEVMKEFYSAEIDFAVDAADLDNPTIDELVAGVRKAYRRSGTLLEGVDQVDWNERFRMRSGEELKSDPFAWAAKDVVAVMKTVVDGGTHEVYRQAAARRRDRDRRLKGRVLADIVDAAVGLDDDQYASIAEHGAKEGDIDYFRLLTYRYNDQYRPQGNFGWILEKLTPLQQAMWRQKQQVMFGGGHAQPPRVGAKEWIE